MPSKTIKIAAIQMDANPAPTPQRLERAANLVDQAASAGAQLVVLPEVFNTGYGYSPENHLRAETLQGPTAQWMKSTAARLNIHLAGSLMLLDGDEVYNALLLFAPDGRMWRYDKNYPWGWERGYFRDSHRITVAQTDLGDIGMMICWDAGHLELWQRYAGQIDLMLISSCPPDIGDPTYHLPGDVQVTFDDFGPMGAFLKGTGRAVFGEMLNQQTAWLGVPTVNTVSCGHIRTAIPNGRASLLSMVGFAPWLAKYLPVADQLEMSCGFMPGCKVVDASGKVLAELPQEAGEAFTLAEVGLTEKKPQPQSSQPPSAVPWPSYLVSDMVLPWLSIPVYRSGLRQAWGERMAPIQASTRQWMLVAGLGALAGFALGRMGRTGKRH